MILNKKIQEYEQSKSIKYIADRVLVCMGGSDHNNLTFFVLNVIDKSFLNFSCDVILSSSYYEEEIVNNKINKIKHKINIFYDLCNLDEPLNRADIAITAGGNTHFDRMNSGVPGIVINQLIHQAETSQKVMD